MRARRAQKSPARSLLRFWTRRISRAHAHIFATRSAPSTVAPSVQLSPARQAEPYSAFIAQNEKERRAAFRLRFQVFNLEMQEGLASSYHTGEDADLFDGVCDHLLVRHEPSGEVVGTYRMQTGDVAACRFGYYSGQEFEFAPYEPLRRQIVELGRACIHPDHRKYDVLMLLWKGIARYAVAHKARYLIGCSSVSSQDSALGSAMYEKLKPMLVEEGLRTMPRAGRELPLSGSDDTGVTPPKLLRAYLSVGARICGPPALDREFQTIDFLTLLDLNNLSPAVRSRFIEV